MDDSIISIDGHELTVGQAMALRVAVTSMLIDLSEDEEVQQQLGSIASDYMARLIEILKLIRV